MVDHSEVIAIDGPAASGKSTVASGVARILEIPYVNTGNMYRAVTLYAMNNGYDVVAGTGEDAIAGILSGISLEYVRGADGTLVLELNGEAVGDAIRSPDVAAKVSLMSAIPEVRRWLVERQRKFAGDGLIVMEGRDIGTVVFPDARYKFFITATPEVRARRRLAQKGEASEGATIESVASEIARRDELDMTRATSPLRKADDAMLIDTSELTVGEILDLIISRVKGRTHANESSS